MEVTRIPFVAALAGTLLLVACGDTVHGVEYAEPAVAEVRAMMKQHEFEKIYDTSSELFRNATPREKGVALFAAIERKLGALRSAKQITWGVNTNNGVTIATLVYASEYEQGQATETFNIEIDHGKGKLAGFNIQSLDMMIR
jgi:hypothetical protein